jgi:adenosylcobinamide kinase/adenosylcobinamide-phosphate guanylyltransferase
MGGTRSGKSLYALRLAETMPKERLYIATAEALDDEMASRIALHRAERDGAWRTLEEPVNVTSALLASTNFGVVLVECLTIWLSNLVGKGLADREIDGEVARLVEAISASRTPIIVVSNELGRGVMPENQLARRFVDISGRANQSVAAAVDDVIFVTAGIAQKLK